MSTIITRTHPTVGTRPSTGEGGPGPSAGGKPAVWFDALAHTVTVDGNWPRCAECHRYRSHEDHQPETLADNATCWPVVGVNVGAVCDRPPPGPGAGRVSMVSTESGVRPAEPGELCTCGRPAVEVYTGGRYGATGHCGLADGGAPVDGVCVFCGDTIDHTDYGRAEAAAGRDGVPFGGDGPQGGRCPLYRLRLADPPPAVHPESVRRFDPAAHRVALAGRRLGAELRALLVAAGLDEEEADISASVTANYVAEVVTLAGEAGDRDPDGLLAVTAMLSYLAEDFIEISATPNPAAVSAYALAEALGARWYDTTVLGRPLLVAQHLHTQLTTSGRVKES